MSSKRGGAKNEEMKEKNRSWQAAICGCKYAEGAAARPRAARYGCEDAEKNKRPRKLGANAVFES